MAAAATAAAELLGAVQDVLAGNDPDATFSSSHYTVHPDHGPNGRIRGFVAEHTLSVTTPNVDGFGAVLAAVTEVAGNTAQIHGLQFRLHETPERVAAARQDAWSDAHGRAQHLAALAGRTLGRAVKIQERHPTAGPPPMMRHAMEMAASVPLAASDADITVALDVEFDFAD